MKHASFLLLPIAFLALYGAHVLAAADMLPNLKALPASDIRIQNLADGTTLLRFSTTGWNAGTGPLELRAGEIDTGNGRQNVYQRIYDDAGESKDTLAGTFVWHPTHNHFHFEDYATYLLQPINAPGGSERLGAKTTFCVMDTTRVNTRLSGSPKKAVYANCGSTVQGMSVGWGDTYGYQLDGQFIDVTNLPDGDYRLTIVLDPKNKLTESEETTDNTSFIDIHLAGGGVSVIGGKPGRR